MSADAKEDIYVRFKQVTDMLTETRKLLDQQGLPERERILLTARADGMIETALDRLDKMSVDLSLTIEAIEPIFDITQGNRGEIKLMDVLYNVFMHGRNAQPREDGHDRVSWFEDTQPWVKGIVERMKVECVNRMEYARGDRATRDRIHRERNL